jgi:hypothetical protein
VLSPEATRRGIADIPLTWNLAREYRGASRKEKPRFRGFLSGRYWARPVTPSLSIRPRVPPDANRRQRLFDQVLASRTMSGHASTEVDHLVDQNVVSGGNLESSTQPVALFGASARGSCD